MGNEYWYQNFYFDSALITTWIIVCSALLLLSIAGLWAIFRKAGEPGWAAIIPFYNVYILYKITWGKVGSFYSFSSLLWTLSLWSSLPTSCQELLAMDWVTALVSCFSLSSSSSLSVSVPVNTWAFPNNSVSSTKEALSLAERAEGFFCRYNPFPVQSRNPLSAPFLPRSL